MFKNNEQKKAIEAQKKLRRFQPTMECMDEDYKIQAIALEENEFAKVIKEFNKLKYTKEELAETKDILFGLIDKVSTEQEVVKMINAGELLSFEKMKVGINELIDYYLIGNEFKIAAPKNSEERKEFYTNMLKGYRYMAEILKEEYEKKNTMMDPLQLYIVLDLIGRASEACATRWKEVLTEVSATFKDAIIKKGKIKIEKNNDRLQNTMKEIFSDAKKNVGDRLSEEFIQEYFGEEFRIYGEGNIPHYLDIFRRHINDRYNANFPIIEMEDAYMAYDSPMGWDIKYKIEDFMEDKDFDKLIFDKARDIFQEKNKNEMEFNLQVVDWADNFFYKNNMELVIPEKVDFLEGYIFANDEDGNLSYTIKEFAMRELMRDKGMVKPISRSLQKDKNGLEPVEKRCRKLINSLKLCDREHNQIISIELKKHEEFFKEDVMEYILTRKFDRNVFNMVINSMPPEIYRDTYINGYELLKIMVEKETVQKYPEYVEEIVKNMLKNDLIIYNDEKKLDELVEILYDVKDKKLIEDLFKNILNNVDLNKNSLLVRRIMTTASKIGSTDIANKIFEKDIVFVQRNLNLNLHLAVKSNNKEMVKLLLSHGADANDREPDGKGRLHEAILFSDKEMVEILLNNGANVSTEDIIGLQAIHEACEKGYMNIVKLLIERGADVNAMNKNGETPLKIAVEYGDLDMAKLLLDNGADVNLTNISGETPVFIASKYGNLDMVKLLLDNGANVNIKNKDWKSPLYLATRFNHREIAELLLNNGAFINERDIAGNTILHTAAMSGSKKMLELVIKKGVDIESKGILKSAIYYAKKNSLKEVKNMLESIENLKNAVEKGNQKTIINILNKEKNNNDYLLFEKLLWNFATSNENVKDVDKIISDFKSENIKDEFGETVLDFAVYKGNMQLAKVAIEKGIDINNVDKNGDTALHKAITLNNMDFIEFLINNGAAVDIKNNMELTAEDKAKELNKYGRTLFVQMVDKRKKGKNQVRRDLMSQSAEVSKKINKNKDIIR